MKHKECCCCHAAPEENSWKVYIAPVLAFSMLLAGMIVKGAGAEFFKEPYTVFLWYALAYMLVGLPVLKEAGESIGRGSWFNEFTLMTLATFGAFYIGEYPEGVAVMLFYTVGELFQKKAVQKARRNIKSLLDIRPETARVIRNTGQVQVAPEEVKAGEIIEVQAGERVPLDGKLLTAEAVFDTAALTGESLPREIRLQEEVLAGMIVTDRVIRMEVTKPYEQTALARILALVEEAAERKAPTELFIRKFAGIYTPAVTLGALLILIVPGIYSLLNPAFVFVAGDWFYRALVFLVVSCPCALVVSIPLGYFGGIGAASRQGILFKGGNYLDAITRVNTVVFDKTGTLTKGVFEVQKIVPAGNLDAERLLQLIASVERQSNHPVARAVVNYAGRNPIPWLDVTETEEIAGYGLTGKIGKVQICVGNIRLLEKCGVDYPGLLKDIPETIVCCALDGQYQGYVLLADEVREDSAQAIRELKQAGIRHIRILSGDKQAIVTKVAESLGKVRAIGELLPEEKAEEVERLKNRPGACVAFVGDGINDAPVLALSQVGIAMGGLGCDTAIETADIVIQNDQPSKVAVAVRIGRQTRRIVWQNIILALGAKGIVLLLGAAGMATLWEAVFADVGVALIAIANAVRLQHHRF